MQLLPGRKSRSSEDNSALILYNKCEKFWTLPEIIYLPGYSQELNPDEMLNQDVKASNLRKRRPKIVRQLKADVRSYLFSTQKHPDIVQKYFEERHVHYARAEAARCLPPMPSKIYVCSTIVFSCFVQLVLSTSSVPVAPGVRAVAF